MSSKKSDKGLDAKPESLETMNPANPEEFTRRGWIYYDRQDYSMARDDFLKALQSNPDNVDIQYALALTLKLLGKKDEAVQTFEKILPGLDLLEDQVRATMLRRLTLGHIHQLTQGDWKIRVNE
jgi:tetratricopeptide (TPR) repeat protein